ncbi:hypothetical protein F2Q70_00009164 [Brassica cretica]|uniref:Secreted protein n=1 Tax=Brassica cretica TaxID=69181 RepID=A0A8S9M4I6_BRACR|nr:hypothetical protein F2Q70_00009164 [Brassica cretica]
MVETYFILVRTTLMVVILHSVEEAMNAKDTFSSLCYSECNGKKDWRTIPISRRFPSMPIYTRSCSSRPPPLRSHRPLAREEEEPRSVFASKASAVL